MSRFSRPLLYILLIASLLFVAIGIAMAADGRSDGWLSIVFFGLCAAVMANRLWPTLLEPRKALTPDPLLQQFPGPVELRTRHAKSVFLLVASTIFAGVSLWMLLHKELNTWVQISLWLGVAFFGAGALAQVAIVVQGASLRLQADGFVVRQLWRRRFTRWHDAGPFAVVAVPPAATKLVAFDDAQAHATKLGAMNHALMGHTAGLPDSYGLSHEDLAALMNRWRERALVANQGPAGSS